jgi:hypothetical protein
MTVGSSKATERSSPSATLPLYQRGHKYRDAFMFPHINQEDLSMPRSLLHFMSARGRFHPSLFAVSDHEVYLFNQAVYEMVAYGYFANAASSQLLMSFLHPDCFYRYLRRQPKPRPY